jgi:hypothetical protein
MEPNTNFSSHENNIQSLEEARIMIPLDTSSASSPYVNYPTCFQSNNTQLLLPNQMQSYDVFTAKRRKN